MRTSEQIEAEIKNKFGFFPPFFSPALQNPPLLENLWHQTLFAYVNNPLPDLFKEKLSAYLSRFCAVPYCLICHSCSLYSLGMQAREVLELLESPLPTQADIDQHLSVLATQSNALTVWSESNTAVEKSLLCCSIFIALEQDQAEDCRKELRRLLGSENYQHLVTFIAYVKTCHEWMKAHPEVAYEADNRAIAHFDTLVEEEPGLADFFRNYSKRVRLEQQCWAQQLAVSAERQRHEREMRLAATENLRLARAIASVSDGVLITDPNQPDNPIIYSNPAFSRMTGYGADEIMGRNCRFLQGPDTDPQTLAQIRHAIAHRQEVKATLLDYRKDGQPFWSELKISPVFSDEGDLLYFVGIQTNITERKQAEQKIREQAALLDITTDAILVRDLENQLLFWSQGAEQLYGWQAEEALGKNAIQLLQEEKTPQLAAVLETVALKGKWQGELPQVTKNGKKILVESRWTLMRDEEEKPKAILVVNTDITEKKQLEAQFLRTQRLESIGTLASGIAHDLNNVLTPILTSAQLLLHPQLSEAKKTPLLETIESSARRGAALVKQVLSFARGVEGKRTAIQIKHLISEIRQIVRETFPKSIEVCTDISQDLWMVCGDATQLHQVLMNLCVNARDAMPHGGMLSLSATNRAIDESYARMNLDAHVGSYVVFTVSDTGVGIPPEVVERMFEPFFTTKEVGKGTGLGLSTVLSIVKSHGGFLEVTSSLEQGTQFSVYLPAIEAVQTPQTSDSELLIGHGELILVVDDEAAIRETNKTSLETYNYRVLIANDGIEAIALYAEYRQEISLVLVDMMMPLMDGATTIRTLRKINPFVKIIAVSGLVSSAQLAQSASAGIQAFLSKPYTAKDLVKTIDEVLSGNNQKEDSYVGAEYKFLSPT